MMDEEELDPILEEKIMQVLKDIHDSFICNLPGDGVSTTSQDFLDYFCNIAENFLVKGLKVFNGYEGSEAALLVLDDLVKSVKDTFMESTLN